MVDRFINSTLSTSLGDDFFDAYNEGREHEARSQGLTYGVWSAILDDDACDYCIWANNRSFLTVGEHPVPPAHFGCRCVVAYFTTEMLDGDLEEEFLAWEDPPISTFPPGSKKRR